MAKAAMWLHDEIKVTPPHAAQVRMASWNLCHFTISDTLTHADRMRVQPAKLALLDRRINHRLDWKQKEVKLLHTAVEILRSGAQLITLQEVSQPEAVHCLTYILNVHDIKGRHDRSGEVIFVQDVCLTSTTNDQAEPMPLLLYSFILAVGKQICGKWGCL